MIGEYDRSCGGYINQETWIAALWAESDEERYIRYQRAYKELARGGRGYAICRLADVIRNDVIDHCPLYAGIYADLLDCALRVIDWTAISAAVADDGGETHE